MKRLISIFAAVVQTMVMCCGAAPSTDIFDAVRAGDVEKVKALLQADPKVAAARTEDGSTALHLAALEGHSAIAQLLLASQAQVNARGLREETPLHMAMYDGHREMAELLLASQADVSAQNTAGETPLHIAARKGHRELVALLLEHHADPNAKDRQDATPLHAAVAEGHKEVVEVLLSQNADLGARDKAGRTPKALAAEKGHSTLVELLTPRVGDYYDVQRLDFEGAKAFPAEALRQGLRDTIDFFEISHPLAPLDAYLEAIQRKVLIGYQNHGFAEAQIEARHDAKAGRIVVKVAEGPRYVCGAVKVIGATNAPVAAIVERLTPSQVTTQAVHQAFQFEDKAPATNPLTGELSEASEPAEASWVKGEPAPLSEIDLRQMKAQVTAVLHEHGFLSAKANLQAVPDKTARTAELQVEVLEEGPRAVIGRIEVTGNKKNSTEAVLRYLDLKPGMELPSQLVARIEDRLWRAARFLSYKVTLGSPDDGGRVLLQVHVFEYDQAPPLDQAFSRTEEAMLKLREWLSRLDQSREDMVVALSGLPAPAPEGEFVLSPCNGLALLTTAMARQTTAHDEYAIVFRAGLAGFYSPVGGRKLLINCPKQELKVFVKVSSKPAETNQSPFNISAGAGFNQSKKKDSVVPSFRFDLALPPVACMGLAHRWDCSSWFDGDVLIRSNATLLVKLDSRTGRILEFRNAGEKGKGMANLRFERGAFERTVQRIETATASLPNVCDTNAPLSSGVAFLAEEVMSSKYLEPVLRSKLSAETAASLPGLVRQLKLEQVLEPMNRLLGKPAGAAEEDADFWIPVDLNLEEATRSDLMGLIVGWFLRRSDELFTARSWPWMVVREASLNVQGKGKYTSQALAEIYESGETGPLGYLAIAQILTQFQPPLAQKFAARGLERLSTADFHHDCHLFLTGDSISSQCCERLAATLREMDDERVAALAKLQSPARGEFVRDCVRRLRAAKGQPVLETLVPALDLYWEKELKEQVANKLWGLALDADTVFKEGLAVYQTLSPNHARAASLFQQAADLGHPAAQYYLAMLYEKGTGVSKDLATALKWYRQSATKGYPEAGVVLGNFYNNGLEVKQDYVEAFVWYGVAAAEGHRMADVFRKGVQRKLTASQLPEAEKRLEAILAQLPPGARAPQPGSAGKTD
jgi:ankyrin repeat protein